MSGIPGLSGEIRGVDRLDDALLRWMLTLMQASYAGVTLEQFTADLEEKDRAILLMDAESGELQGISTLLEMHVPIRGQPEIVIYSGDTVIAPEAWGRDVDI